MVTKSLVQMLQVLFAKYRWAILATYGLTFLENLFDLIYPFITGMTIDGLLKGNYTALIALTCIWLIHTITGVFRNVYDTRTFSRIYASLASTIVLEQEQQGIPTSQIVARSALSREFVDFFEQDIPRIVTALFGFIGALVMLLFYDLQIVLYCLLLFIPLLTLNHFYARRSLTLNHKLNSQLENEVDILTRCQPGDVQLHYRLLATHRIHLSNAMAFNWGVMELFIIVLFVAVITRTVALPNAQPGDIYAIISYVWNYRQSLDVVPTLVQQLSRLQDIGERMQFD
ncbi:ABC transporter six-transmembrane domain-containing protein [Kovacikia minuta CCNUW1]|uniref:ABC transporter six-transmembrane domain-containing protein n=1 Tax=Kovacikia minuta TaxID=2931930 RepID=UPI001CCD76B6|nr:ABC transporter six-transmembrane domain-containing protein [Kovacikia minuta]UBF24612.1 ABC transporter six-transmembrane domain-containing protein [Kovacikia minuta CCNUW1]